MDQEAEYGEQKAQIIIIIIFSNTGLMDTIMNPTMIQNTKINKY